LALSLAPWYLIRWRIGDWLWIGRSSSRRYTQRSREPSNHLADWTGIVSSLMRQFRLTSIGMLAGRPDLVFLVSSILIGVLTVLINPPLRGPDETAHFLRALGIAEGEWIPRTADPRGRRGLFLPAEFHKQFSYFNELRETPSSGRRAYMEILRSYRDGQSTAERQLGWVFVPYEGSEGYSPIPYLPYAAAALVARILEFQFLETLYFMRIAGLLTASLIAACAITLTPSLQWMFFCAAMLPTALYQRAVISVDGAVLSTTLLLIALCLRAVDRPGGGAWHRGVWVTVCSLTKPPQLAFALLEMMRLSVTTWRAQWLTALLVTVPGVVLSLLWIVAVSADMGAWRVSEGSGLPPEEFDPTWKLLFLLEHPYEFISAAITSLDYTGELWRQLIGVFGWLDVPMRNWVYPLISLLLVVTLFDEMNFNWAARSRIAIIAAFTAFSYCVAVACTLFITLTPSTAGRIYGLQGRYFIVILPLLALIVSAIVNRGFGRASALAATTSAVVSAAAMMEALWRVQWTS
jgi:hypothetical protein